MASSEYAPARITARLRTGVVCDPWLPLDAILDYQVKRERFGAQQTTRPGGEPAPSKPDPDVPLQAHHAGTENWYYACSWAQPQPWWVAEGTDYWNKRFDAGFADLVDFGGRRGKVIIEQGPYKAYHMPIFYRTACQIEWYAVGDLSRIRELLATVTHIGKKRSQGWGRVTEWIVEPWPEDWSVRCDGYLTRGIPVFDASAPYDVMSYGLHPPYYSKWNQIPIARPNSTTA
jgi:CRISPR type IV-associated protein Csf3